MTKNTISSLAILLWVFWTPGYNPVVADVVQPSLPTQETASARGGDPTRRTDTRLASTTNEGPQDRRADSFDDLLTQLGAEPTGYAAEWAAALESSEHHQPQAPRSTPRPPHMVHGVRPEGCSQFVSLFRRNGRYVISVLQVLEIKTIVSDPLVPHEDEDRDFFIIGITNNARRYLGLSAGVWESSTWSFKASHNEHNLVTVVSKLMLPKSVVHHHVAEQLVIHLNGYYRFPYTKKVHWFYPKPTNYPKDLPSERVPFERALHPEGASNDDDEHSMYGILSSVPMTPKLATYIMAYFTPEYYGQGHLLMSGPGPQLADDGDQQDPKAASAQFGQRATIQPDYCTNEVEVTDYTLAPDARPEATDGNAGCEKEMYCFMLNDNAEGC